MLMVSMWRKVGEGTKCMEREVNEVYVYTPCV